MVKETTRTYSRRRLNFFELAAEVAFHPSRFFGREDFDAKYNYISNSLLFFVKGTMMCLGVPLVIALFLSSKKFLGTESIGLLFILLPLVLVPLAFIIGSYAGSLFITGGIIQLTANWLGGKETFSTTFAVMVYSMSPVFFLLSVISLAASAAVVFMLLQASNAVTFTNVVITGIMTYVVALAAFVWSMTTQVVGLKERHHMTTSKATVAACAPLLLFFAFIIVAGAVYSMAILLSGLAQAYSLQ